MPEITEEMLTAVLRVLPIDPDDSTTVVQVGYGGQPIWGDPHRLAKDILAAAWPHIEAERLRSGLERERREHGFYQGRYMAVQRVLDEALGRNEEDGAGGGIAGDVKLLAAQRDEARAEVQRAQCETTGVREELTRMAGDLDDRDLTVARLQAEVERLRDTRCSSKLAHDGRVVVRCMLFVGHSPDMLHWTPASGEWGDDDERVICTCRQQLPCPHHGTTAAPEEGSAQVGEMSREQELALELRDVRHDLEHVVQERDQALAEAKRLRHELAVARTEAEGLRTLLNDAAPIIANAKHITDQDLWGHDLGGAWRRGAQEWRRRYHWLRDADARAQDAAEERETGPAAHAVPLAHAMGQALAMLSPESQADFLAGFVAGEAEASAELAASGDRDTESWRDGHGVTAHGHRCCDQAPEWAQPKTRNGCGGVSSCGECWAWVAEHVHNPDPPCPTCSGSVRRTVDMVCQTCGTDYGPDATERIEVHQYADGVHGVDHCHACRTTDGGQQ